MKVKPAVHNGTVRTLCGMCNARCGIRVTVRNGVLVDIAPVADHPLNQGRLCPRAAAAIDVFYHPQRILQPLKRTADGSFEPISREQALDEIAEKLQAVRRRHGARAVGVWKGEALGFLQQEEYARRFIHAFGSPNYLSNDSACYNGRYLGQSLVTGFYHPFPAFERAELILLFGTNPPMGHPPFMREFADARQRGAKLVVIDPRLNPIACYADIFAQPYPGTDGALGWGLLNRLIQTRNYDRELVEQYSLGFEQLARYAERFTPQVVEELSGVYASVVEEIAQLIIAHQPRISIFSGTGLEHHDNGVNTIRVLTALACLWGGLDAEGGLFWPRPMGIRKLTLYDEVPLREEQPIGAGRFPVLYEFRRECHTMEAMEHMLGRGSYPLKALVLTGANPAVTNPNTAKVEEALSSLELLVVNELFLTRTARLAHYVLPAAGFLERSDLHFTFKEQMVSLTEKVAEIEGVHEDYRLWRDLAQRLGFGETYFPWPDEEAVNRWLLEPTGITVEDLRRSPNGLVYEPPVFGKHRLGPLPTPSGKVEFASQYLESLGLPELPEYRPPYHLRQHDPEYPFVLTTGARKSLLYHSRHQNIARFRTVHPAAAAELHPADAARLGIRDGEVIRITSRVGALEIPAHIVSEAELREGVVEVYHGWEDCRINFVTFDEVNDPISGFPLLKGVPVRIEKTEKAPAGPAAEPSGVSEEPVSV